MPEYYFFQPVKNHLKQEHPKAHKHIINSKLEKIMNKFAHWHVRKKERRGGQE